MTTVVIVANAEVLGGAELYAARLYAGLQSSVRATLVGRLPGWNAAGLPDVEVEVGPKWSRRNIFRSAVNARKESRSLIDAALAVRADWAHLQYKREQILLTRTLAHSIPVLWTEHGLLYTGPGSPALRAAYRRAATATSAIVCNSVEVAADVRNTVNPGTRIEIINNPVDGNLFRPADSIAGRAALRRKVLPPDWWDEPVAVVAARLHPAKRIERAIQAAIAIDRPLLVVGAGSDRTRLVQLAGDKRVHFTGHRDDIDEVFRACDQYVFTGTASGEGGQPLVLLEAAASGLPVVGYSGDAAENLIERLGGTVLSPGEPLPEVLAPSKGGRDYVLQHHSVRGWQQQYLDILAAA